MKTLAKRVIVQHGPQRAPLCGFAGYVSHSEPILLRRVGWEIANDIHDAFYDQLSKDNGRTWSPPRPSLGMSKVAGGYIAHTENAIVLLPDGSLMHFTNDKFEHESLAGCDLSNQCRVRVTIGPADQLSQARNIEQLQAPGLNSTLLDLDSPQGLTLSFAHPALDEKGRMQLPLQWQQHDHDGSIRAQGLPCRKDLPDVMLDVWQAGLAVGTPRENGQWHWAMAGRVPCGFALSSRGLFEPALAQLPGGRLAMVLRGSNALWPERPGYKWVSYSDDHGRNWSPATPLPCSDGTLLESSSTGSAFFRSQHDGRLYWLGTLCVDGRRPSGNMPRSPLVIARMQEEPLAIEASSITVIDRHQSGESPDTQHSNFKFYQDRQSGDLVLYLTRYGERGNDNDAWLQADLYEYRVAMA